MITIFFKFIKLKCYNPKQGLGILFIIFQVISRFFFCYQKLFKFYQMKCNGY